MLASRLLTILMLLQTRGRVSATDLAAEFEVSVRTVYRDIDQLSAAGVPVYAERGRNGGFKLLDGYRTKLTGLTQPEAEALLLMGLWGPAADLGLSHPLSGARLKLTAALPPALRTDAERIASRVHLDPVGWFRNTSPAPYLPTIARAVFGGLALKLRYRPAGKSEPRLRELGPLGLVLKAGAWYLVAQSGKSVRTYRVANVENAELSNMAFARPRDFDLASYWQKTSRDYEWGTYQERAQVRISPTGMARLELLGSYVVKEAVKTASKPDRQGWVRCVLPVESGDYGVRELMRLGDEVEVIGPASLRARMIALLASMARRHSSSVLETTLIGGP
jgi:predicted DNA-binding transcriptional regulator YafY